VRARLSGVLSKFVNTSRPYVSPFNIIKCGPDVVIANWH
jgi:hypothetical protein